MIFLNPEQSVTDQEILHFMFAVIKYLGTPVRMFSFSRICIFIQAGSVKLCQSEGISREMSRYPVENDSDLILVEIVYKELEVFRRSVTGSRSKIIGHLISPGSIKRMLCNSHKLHMGVSHLLHILGQFHCQFPVVVISVLVLFRRLMSSPGTRMHFVDKHRTLLIIELFAFFHPFLIIPFEVGDIRHDGSIIRTFFRIKSIRIHLQDRIARFCFDGIFVKLAHCKIRNE